MTRFVHNLVLLGIAMLATADAGEAAAQMPLATQVNLTTGEIGSAWHLVADLVTGPTPVNVRVWTRYDDTSFYVLESDVTCPGATLANTYYALRTVQVQANTSWTRRGQVRYRIMHGVEQTSPGISGIHSFIDRVVYRARTCAGTLSLDAYAREGAPSPDTTHRSLVLFTRLLENRYATSFGVKENPGST